MKRLNKLTNTNYKESKNGKGCKTHIKVDRLCKIVAKPNMPNMSLNCSRKRQRGIRKFISDSSKKIKMDKISWMSHLLK